MPNSTSRPTVPGCNHGRLHRTFLASPYLETGYWLKPAGPATPEILRDVRGMPPQGPALKDGQGGSCSAASGSGRPVTPSADVAALAFTSFD